MENSVDVKFIYGFFPLHAQVKIGEYCSCLCTFYFNGKAKVMVVDDVWTREDKRKMGLATKLMKEIIKLAENYHVDSIELLCHDQNVPALSLYEKMGFIKTEKTHHRMILNKWTTSPL